MKALIKDDKVIQISEKEFPVHPDLKWIDCDETVTTKQEYKNGQFVKKVEPEPEPKNTRGDLIRKEMRDMAIESLKAKGVLDANGELIGNGTAEKG